MKRPKSVDPDPAPVEERPRYRLDPNNPNVIALANLVDELAWEFVTTHTPEEVEAAIKRSDEHLRLVRQMFKPVPVQSCKPVQQGGESLGAGKKVVPDAP